MTENEVLSWIADLFEEPLENIKPETSRKDIPGWDSLGVLNLMAGLDEEFNIQLTDEEIQELREVEDILKMLRQYGVFES